MNVGNELCSLFLLLTFLLMCDRIFLERVRESLSLVKAIVLTVSTLLVRVGVGVQISIALYNLYIPIKIQDCDVVDACPQACNVFGVLSVRVQLPTVLYYILIGGDNSLQR